jgi:hypothetical protein
MILLHPIQGNRPQSAQKGVIIEEVRKAALYTHGTYVDEYADGNVVVVTSRYACHLVKIDLLAHSSTILHVCHAEPVRSLSSSRAEETEWRVMRGCVMQRL